MGVKKWLKGRDFSEDFVSDSTAIVVNKAAIKIMGLKIRSEQSLTCGARNVNSLAYARRSWTAYGDKSKTHVSRIDDWGLSHRAIEKIERCTSIIKNGGKHLQEIRNQTILSILNLWMLVSKNSLKTPRSSLASLFAVPVGLLAWDCLDCRLHGRTAHERD